MKTPKNIALFLLAAAFVSCSDSIEEQPEVGNVLCFSVSHEWTDETPLSRSSWDMDFEKGNEIEVFACYSERANTSSFSPNFMNRQIVSYNGSSWSYSPLKYWPYNGQMKFHAWAPAEQSHEANPYLQVTGYESSGMSVLSYECRTGLDPFYEANAVIDIANGVLSGNSTQGGNGRVTLTFHPAPNRYDIVATADTKLYNTPDPNPTGEYQECRFLIRSFKIWGVYKKAEYSMSEDKWYNHVGMYTKREPLDMTPYLNWSDTETSIPGYKYDPEAGYDTKQAVIVGESVDGEHTNLFSKPGFFIPADVADIPGNEAGFEIQYVVLTNRPGETDYKETGIITRSGSLKNAFDNKHNGRVRFVTNINLHFSIEELTVTCNLYDYKYKPMF